jgi:hypothetical protein
MALLSNDRITSYNYMPFLEHVKERTVLLMIQGVPIPLSSALGLLFFVSEKLFLSPLNGDRCHTKYVANCLTPQIDPINKTRL